MSNPKSQIYHEKSPQDQMATWGSVVFASKPAQNSVPPKDSTLTSQSGVPNEVYAAFVSSGSLNNKHDPYTAGNLMAFAHDLGVIDFNLSAIFSIGLDRLFAIDFLGNPQTGYYRSVYDEIPAAVDAFISDYEAAEIESRSFDNQIEAAAGAISRTILISWRLMRQVFGTMEITIPLDTLSTEAPMVFLKEVSNDGNVNTIDVIYPTYPILYTLAPEYIRYLLQPYIIYLEEGS
ncbi:hypothetical protein MMC18_001631 [Xylographa bjoerkii]|nr:hypothetical protein [Xylographa bjoerkii]